MSFWFPADATVWLVVLGITVAGAALGLPDEFLDCVAWLVTSIRIALQIPSERRFHRRYLQKDVLIPELREWLNRQTTPSYDLVLHLRGADGLTLPAGQGPLVRTTAVEACVREVNRSRPAAVGIAGSRGVGKSTIVERAVANEFTDEDREPMLGVLTTAPVRYDARDFVLHLHACVCRAVLDLLASGDDPQGSETYTQWERLFWRHWFRQNVLYIVRKVVRALVWSVVALGLAELAWGWTTDVETTRSHVVGFVDHVQRDPSGFLGHLDLSDIAGVLALLCAFGAVWVLLWSVPRPLVWGLLEGLWSRMKRMSGVTLSTGEKALRGVAQQHLRQIRFLQTHTSGWSGKVSAPVGSELGLTRSHASAEQPWTHPEVVQRLREFLTLVVEVLRSIRSRLSGIVIAIDELDKISDPEEAHRFLNEIKGVFGVPHCLFLVSVSDDALTAFERRGIPARDAFDSTFTTMIHVQPFTLAESRAWLAQRALGIPEPFVWLCHCMSGGLPRDLGRTALAMHDLQETHFRLADLTVAMISQDLDLKIRAFTHTARHTQTDVPGQPYVLIKALQAVPTTDVTQLAKLAQEIWPEPEPPSTPLAELCAEVACYLLFCQTVTDVFHDAEGLAALARVAPLGVENTEDAVAMLARARQQMAIDTTLARSLVMTFRDALAVPPNE